MTRSPPINHGSNPGRNGAGGKHAGPLHAPQGEAGAREPLSDGRRGPNTNLHSPAGVRPKFGHSLEHIVLRKKPPPPGKETEAGGVAAPRRGPAPPARAQAEGFCRREGDSLALAEKRTGQLLAGGGVAEAHSASTGRERNGRGAGDALRRREEHPAHAPGREQRPGGPFVTWVFKNARVSVRLMPVWSPQLPGD